MDVRRNSEFLNAQLTIAHWYVDHAEASSADGRSRYLAYAREAYDIVGQLLSVLNLESEQRERIGVKVVNLARRLESPPQRAGKLDGADPRSAFGNLINGPPPSQP